MVVVKHKRVHQGTGYPATQATRSVRKRYILKMEWDPKAFDSLGLHMRQFFSWISTGWTINDANFEPRLIHPLKCGIVHQKTASLTIHPVN